MTRPTDWTTSTTRVARVEEQHGVQRGHVHAFGQAAGVGEDAAGVGGRSALSQSSSVAAAQRVEGAVDVVDLDSSRLGVVGLVLR